MATNTSPTTMKAIQILGTRSNPTVTLNPSLPLPPLQPTAILIHTHAAALTAHELSWPELYATPSRIPGHDIAGTVAALPESYTGDLKVGDAVYAMLHADRGQGQAGWVYALENEVARMPGRISHVQAAALPIPVLTAWEGLERVGHGWLRGREEGQGGRVLVTGAAGAVGRMVVQLVRVLVPGVEVVALARGESGEELLGLGAGRVVDYAIVGGDGGWEKEVGKVDMVFDTVGGEVLTRAWNVVKDDGVVVTVADPPPAWAFDKGVVPDEARDRPGVRYIYFILSPDKEALEKVAGMIDDGVVKPLPVVEFPVDKAVEAWEFAGKRSRQGKVVINFADDE